MSKKVHTYIDLFAGCGGLSLGLHNAGWHGLFAIEKNSDAFKTLKYNLIDKKKHFDWPEWLPEKPLEINSLLHEYKDQLSEMKGKVDLVVGGPPCQGFSTAGRRKEDDTRNGLIDSYIEFITAVRPKFILFENVKGFTQQFVKAKSAGRKYSDYVKEKLVGLGYRVHGDIINFSEFGVPQTRHRFILVGIKVTEEIDPEKFFNNLFNNKNSFLKTKSLSSGITIATAISDLERKNGEVASPDSKNFKAGIYGEAKNNFQKLMRRGSKSLLPDSHRFANHKKEIEDRFSFTIKEDLSNKQIQQIFKLKKLHTTKLDPNKPSPTLTTLPDDYIHYNEPRIMTVREYARIQTFPDWFHFQGRYTTGGKNRVLEVPRYTQIGNAIPPLFGEQVGLILKQLNTYELK